MQELQFNFMWNGPDHFSGRTCSKSGKGQNDILLEKLGCCTNMYPGNNRAQVLTNWMYANNNIRCVRCFTIRLLYNTHRTCRRNGTNDITNFIYAYLYMVYLIKYMQKLFVCLFGTFIRNLCLNTKGSLLLVLPVQFTCNWLRISLIVSKKTETA